MVEMLDNERIYLYQWQAQEGSKIDGTWKLIRKMSEYNRSLYDNDGTENGLPYPLLFTPDFEKYLIFNFGT